MKASRFSEEQIIAVPKRRPPARSGRSPHMSLSTSGYKSFPTNYSPQRSNLPDIAPVGSPSSRVT
jgi:hypothetical protein